MGGYGWVFVEGRRWKSGQVETKGQEGEERLDIYIIGRSALALEGTTMNKERGTKNKNEKKNEKFEERDSSAGNKHCPVNVPVDVC